MLAAADNRSYAQAAKACNTSRQNIAHSVKMLESELGPTLFERSGNEMVLTDEGKEVVLHARSIIARVDNLYDTYVGRDEGDSPLNVAVSPNLFAGMPPRIDSFFLNRSDRLNLYELSCEKCYESVCSGRVDLAIVMCMHREFPNCNTMELAYSTAFALLSTNSQLALNKTLDIADLLGEKIMVMSEPDWQYHPLFEQLDALGYDRSDISTIPSTSTMLRILRSQNAIGLVSGQFAASPPHHTKPVPFADPEFDWHFYLLYKQGTRKLQSILALAKGLGDAFGASAV